MPLPLIADLGTTEILIILAVIVLLFGAKKLPDLARGSGQALRIFKAETKELKDGDKNKDKTAGSDTTGAPAGGETVVRAEQVDPSDDQHRSDA